MCKILLSNAIKENCFRTESFSRVLRKRKFLHYLRSYHFCYITFNPILISKIECGAINFIKREITANPFTIKVVSHSAQNTNLFAVNGSLLYL